MKWNSLYWRIAAGFVAALALLLVVQAVLIVWVVARSGSSVPNQPPGRQAQTIALDVAQLLSRDPAANIETYIRQEYERDAQPFFVVLVDGRTIEFGGPFPDELVADARARLSLRDRGTDDRRDPRVGPSPLGPRGMLGFRGGRGGPAGQELPGGPETAFRRLRPGVIVANGNVVGLVVVPIQPAFRFLLARYGPILSLVALATLLVGGVLVTAIVFGPARRRLLAVEKAARRLGAGDLTARAPTTGSDEVAAVALAFNSMADDLAARANALAASDRARRQLLADVSHELTTPVTAMRGYLETLTRPELTLEEGTRAR